ncbi:Mrp/NBP35 family ATP-binding protein [Metabacillus niabensis]|uniref:Iron-sulfur cluster carrier protein n=1 Tax=Metabacillus niabensis TaxID=324854 RepID=A0ABT9Z6F0_9BACI|nr:Mrp/NBP35 family ATP-binding protein [Metabacillus niabensis]MDQ0227421.1 Mrp family chromosome partitioning ATPase [Metabacillus niabensis]
MINGSAISITSGKGGVGKSTVSVNLAIALANMGKTVALIDLDIYGFSIPKMMKIINRPKTINGKIIPLESHGVKIMSMGFLIKNNEPVVWRGPMLGKMVEHFSYDVMWGDLDYVLFDMPPGTGDVALDLHHLIPQSKEIIITTPQETASHVAERAGVMAKKANHEIIGVVENMAYFKPNDSERHYFIFGQGGGQKLADKLQVNLLSQLPIEEVNINTETPSIYQEGTLLYSSFQMLAKQVDEIIKYQ